MGKIIELMKNSDYTIAFTGAGVSTFSGLKDFRGEKGLGKIMEPEKIFDIHIFNSDPSFFYSHARELVYDLENIRPSLVHMELARLEKAGAVQAVITQNIDRLHQRAGSKKVIEVHGTAETAYCRSCGERYYYHDMAPAAARGDVPRCRECGGVIKPDITFYGESLPERAVMEALEASSKADLIIALGSTLVVYPAASFIDTSLQNGGKLIVVNNQPTPYDGYAAALCTDLEEFCRLTAEGF
ncbi:MAG: NAD-dependent deacetylase [Spirochaetales bacterium]|nr:NAD-dependent deacetylase [Spirochaetales bacterium]